MRDNKLAFQAGIDTASIPVKRRILISVIIAVLAGFLSTLSRTVSYNGVQIGDIGSPLVCFQSFLSGHGAYPQLFYTFEGGKGATVEYPFTTMLFLAPLLLFPLQLIGPLFCALSSFIFAYALLYDGKTWRLLVLLSVPYLSALQSVQFSPLFSAAVLIPSLLPLAVIKPQLGIALLAAGKWSFRTLLVTLSIVAISLLIYPAWPIEWFRHGNLSSYEGRIPAFQGLGFLVFISLFKWRDERSRLLLAMALIPQRLWYDHLMLFLLPKTRQQLYILLIGSWLSLLLSTGGLFIDSGPRSAKSWTFVVSLVYFPALLIVYSKEISTWTSRLRDLFCKYF